MQIQNKFNYASQTTSFDKIHNIVEKAYSSLMDTEITNYIKQFAWEAILQKLYLSKYLSNYVKLSN